MRDHFEALLSEARSARANDPAASRALYDKAAQGARSENRPAVLAHALRHLSDIDRLDGDSKRAEAEANQAVALYRTVVADDVLGLANALRLTAMVKSADDAGPYWAEARDLYVKLDLPDGVEDCDRNLAKSQP